MSSLAVLNPAISSTRTRVRRRTPRQATLGRALSHPTGTGSTAARAYGLISAPSAGPTFSRSQANQSLPRARRRTAARGLLASADALTPVDRRFVPIEEKLARSATVRALPHLNTHEPHCHEELKHNHETHDPSPKEKTHRKRRRGRVRIFFRTVRLVDLLSRGTS